MTDKKVKSGTIDVKAPLAGDEKFLRTLVRTALQKSRPDNYSTAGRDPTALENAD